MIEFVKNLESTGTKLAISLSLALFAGTGCGYAKSYDGAHSFVCDISHIYFSNPGIGNIERSEAMVETWFLGVNSCAGLDGDSLGDCMALELGELSQQRNSILTPLGIGTIKTQFGSGILDGKTIRFGSEVGLALSIDLQKGELFFGSEISATRDDLTSARDRFEGFSGYGTCRLLDQIG